MKLNLNQYNLISLDNLITNSKDYYLDIAGYQFSSKDQKIIIEQKKSIKIINLKELGKKNSILYFSDSLKTNVNFDKLSFEYGLSFFQGFDEDIGYKYSFLPKFSINKIEELNENISKLGTSIQFEQTNKGIAFQQPKEENISSEYSFLLAFAITYGNWDIKNNDLKSIKIQIPLLGIYENKVEIFNKIRSSFAKKGQFMVVDRLKNKDGIVYQISITDYELLKIFSQLQQNIFKIKTVSKLEYSQNFKLGLLKFIEENNIEISEELSKRITNGYIKLLKN